MNIPPPSTEPAADGESAAPGITIIYEDRVCGVRAKRFSDMLLVSLGGGTLGKLGCWRSELAELPDIAEEMSRDAAASEFVILSIRGDSGFSFAMKRWIESWLAGATGRPSSLVALVDAERSTMSHGEAARCYLRHVAANADVAFFSHCMAAASEEADAAFPEEKEFIAGRPAGRRSRNGIGSLSRTAVAA